MLFAQSRQRETVAGLDQCRADPRDIGLIAMCDVDRDNGAIFQQIEQRRGRVRENDIAFPSGHRRNMAGPAEAQPLAQFRLGVGRVGHTDRLPAVAIWDRHETGDGTAWSVAGISADASTSGGRHMHRTPMRKSGPDRDSSRGCCIASGMFA